ncbi:MAG: hypothetical protein EPO20_17005 [Betaproteobacteria bacterium]|nr:MAG: hypothetical protein EPO20_17005 [Betaproteobacteria bacterium]
MSAQNPYVAPRAAVGDALSAAIGEIGIFAAYAAIFVISIMLTIQRSHDFNTTGRLAIPGLVPLVNLVFRAIPAYMQYVKRAEQRK